MKDQLIAQLKFEEGGRSKAYRCTKGDLTIGYGHNLDKNPKFLGTYIPKKIDQLLAESILIDDIMRTERELLMQWHGFSLMPDVIKDALINMAFQMGVSGLLKFKKTLHYLIRAEWDRAADEALDSDWARHDSPERAKRVSGQIRSGQYYHAPEVKFI
jgi:lysozyme